MQFLTKEMMMGVKAVAEIEGKLLSPWMEVMK